MIAWLSALPTRLWGYLAAFIAGGAAIIGAYLRGRSSARAEAEGRALGRDLDLRRTRDEVDRTVARVPDAAQRLRDEWSRD